MVLVDMGWAAMVSRAVAVGVGILLLALSALSQEGEAGPGDGDGGGSTLAPTAVIDYTPASPRVAETITFDASLSVDPEDSMETYVWEIAGEAKTGEQVQHVFETAGPIEVSLTVTDDTGQSDSDAISMTVLDADDPEPEQPSGYGESRYGEGGFGTGGISTRHPAATQTGDSNAPVRI